MPLFLCFVLPYSLLYKVLFFGNMKKVGGSTSENVKFDRRLVDRRLTEDWSSEDSSSAGGRPSLSLSLEIKSTPLKQKKLSR